MDIQETALPGVGLRHEFTACAGRNLGVVSYRTGRRDLLLYDPDDPDTCHEVIRLTHEEADALADLLGAARLTGHLAELQGQRPGPGRTPGRLTGMGTVLLHLGGGTGE
jgi:TrkA domain protein